MLAIFRAQKVPPRGALALGVFHRAVEAQRAGAELARRLGEYLEKARRDPRLKFKA